MDWKAITSMDPSVVEAMQKPKDTLVLREPITIDELYALMAADESRFPGGFRLKKGLFGATIVFDRYMYIGAAVRVKKNAVVVSRVERNNNVTRNGRMNTRRAVDFVQTAGSVFHAIKTGEIGDDLIGGAKYYMSIRDTMRELLKSLTE